MKTTDTVLVSLFAALTAACALFSIPIGPVPITLQSLVSLVAGALLGPLRGALSQTIYLALGLLGLPVFAGGGGGIGWFFGPTGGFLVGFVACSLVVGLVVQGGCSGPTPLAALLSPGGPAPSIRRPAIPRVALGVTLGLASLYSCGVAGLVLVSGLRPSDAICTGVLPFVAGDVVKAAVAVVLIRASYR